MQMTRMLLISAAGLAMLTAPAAAQEPAAQAPAAATTAPVVNAELAALRIIEIDDRDIYGADGEEIGEVEGVYRSGTAEPFIRMEVDDGWFDIGEEVVVPLSNFTLVDGRLSLPITEDQAEALEEWTEGDYEDMAEAVGNETLADVYDELD